MTKQTIAKATKREKQDLIIAGVLENEVLAEKIGKLTLVQAEAFEQVVANMVASFLLSDKKVTLGDVVTVEPRKRDARKGRNPQTGAEIEIAASVGLGVKPTKGFKDELNGK